MTKKGHKKAWWLIQKGQSGISKCENGIGRCTSWMEGKY